MMSGTINTILRECVRCLCILPYNEWERELALIKNWIESGPEHDDQAERREARTRCVCYEDLTDADACIRSRTYNSALR